MAVKLQSFPVIEDTLARTLTSAWVPQAKKIQKKIKAALRDGDDEAAIAALDDLDFGSVFEAKERQVDFLLITSLLFGTSRIVPPSQGVFAGGDLPDVFETAKNQLRLSLTISAEEQIRKKVAAVVNQEVPAFKAEEYDHHVVVQKKAVELTLVQQIEAAVAGTGKGLIKVGANLTTSRLISYGYLSQATTSNIKQYQITEILDGNTCPVCQSMHGRVFNVEQTLSRIETLLRTTDPMALKTMAPFPSQSKAGIASLRSKSNADLQSAGIDSPPFHPACRGVLVKVGDATTVTRAISRRLTPLPAAPKPVPVPAGLTGTTSAPFDLMDDFLTIDATATEQALAGGKSSPGFVVRRTKALDKLGEKNVNRGKSISIEVGLKVEEIDALQTYSGKIFRSVNTKLRTGSLPGLTSSSPIVKDINKTINLLDLALKKNVLDRDIIVYRKWGRTVNLEGLEVGDIVTDKAFVSTSILRMDALTHGTSRIRLPKGTPGWYINKIGNHNNEFEVLLPRNSRFRVVAKVSEKQGVFQFQGAAVEGKIVETELELIL